MIHFPVFDNYFILTNQQQILYEIIQSILLNYIILSKMNYLISVFILITDSEMTNISIIKYLVKLTDIASTTLESMPLKLHASLVYCIIEGLSIC